MLPLSAISRASFAATNEREGSELARQIMTALLLEGDVRFFCVTHLHGLAHGFNESDRKDARFLRAQRQADGTRTYKLAKGEPLATSFGVDLYNRIFCSASPGTSGSKPGMTTPAMTKQPALRIAGMLLGRERRRAARVGPND